MKQKNNEKELHKIRKIYGEKFMNLCRELFPEILEQNGTLLQILRKTFSTNCNDLDDVLEKNCLKKDFQKKIFKIFYEQKRTDETQITKTENNEDFEVISENDGIIEFKHENLEKTGYRLLQCKTEDAIQRFKKYYAPEELICSIYNKGALERHDCFWIVKKNVDEIKRENFKNPHKRDEYSTSVLAIQFYKDSDWNNVKIISRYNHSVDNPDCTFENNLNNIVEGLQDSFARKFGYKLNIPKKVNLEIPGYIEANNGMYYKYNYLVNGKYYCPGNIVVNNGNAEIVSPLSSTILCDYFIIDMKNKEVKLLEETGSLIKFHDSFIDDLKDIKKIEIVKNAKDKTKSIIIYKKNINEKRIIIKIDRDNRIIEYTNENVKEIDDNFMRYNRILKMLHIPNVEKIGHNFLPENEGLKEFTAANLVSVGDNCLSKNEIIEVINARALRSVGNSFCSNNKKIKIIDFPKLEQIGDDFFTYIDSLFEIVLSSLKRTGNNFLYNIMNVNKFEAPNLEEVGHSCLFNLRNKFDFPKLKKKGWNFCYYLARIEQRPKVLPYSEGRKRKGIEDASNEDPTKQIIEQIQGKEDEIQQE